MITGKIKNIPLKGLTTAVNDYYSDDGDMMICHNVCNSGSGLKGVGALKSISKLDAGWKGLVFVHKTSVGDIHIIVDNENNAWFETADNKTKINYPANGLFEEGKYKITSVGNILVVSFTGSEYKGIHYYRYKETGEYKYLGQAPPDIKLEFSAAHYAGNVSGEGDVSLNDGYMVSTDTQNQEIQFTADLQFSQGSMLSYESKYEDYPKWLDYLLGRINEIKGELRRQGLFIGKFFVRTAYRLYDGSYIMQSAPIMIAPSQEDNPIIWPYLIKPRLTEDGNSYTWNIGVKSKILFRPFVLCAKTLISQKDAETLKEWTDVIDTICVFITPQLQSYTEDPKNIVLVRKEKIPYYGISGQEDNTSVPGHVPEEYSVENWRKGAYAAYMDEGLSLGSIVSTRYSPPRLGSMAGELNDKYYIVPEGNDANNETSTNMVMQSQECSFFRDAGLGDTPDPIYTAMLYHSQYLDFNKIVPEESMVAYVQRMLAEFGFYHHIIKFEQKSDTEEQQVESSYLFYPLKEYTIEEALKLGSAEDTDNKTMTWPYLNLNQSSTVWPRKGDVINAPTDMSFVKFPKDTLDNLTARTDTLTDDYNSWQSIQPQLMHTYNGRLNAANINVIFRDIPYTWLGGQAIKGEYNIRGQVVIETNGTTTTAALPDVSAYNIFVNMGYFYYPHPDAKRIELILYGSRYVLITIKLKTHPFLHGAYFYDADFDIDKYGMEYDSLDDTVNALTKSQGAILYPNYMYTSEVDNPFFFPAEGVNVIGTGKIIAIKSATKAMSEGTAYGTLPLYAFCTDGIWPLSVGQTGLFVATNPPTRETLLNNDPDSALQIDNAIVFLSDRGLMQLIGERTTLLSADLSERYTSFNANDLPGFSIITERIGLSDLLEGKDFSEYIHSDARIAFDYANYRIVIYRPYNADDKGTHVAYLYDLSSKMWTTIDNRMTSSVEDYPGTIVNMVDDDNKTTIAVFDKLSDALISDKAMYITRPLKIDSPDSFKTIRTLLQRSTLSVNKSIVMWGSRDMNKWLLVGAADDDKLIRLSGTPYKYFVVGAWVQISVKDSISQLTAEYVDKLTNRLR